MHQRKGKKIFVYLFLFILVSSVNNINLQNTKFLSEKKIEIFGLNEIETKKLFEDTNNINFENIFILNKKEILNVINSNTIIEKFSIFKKYPSTIIINIQKTNFLAKINIDGTLYFVGSNGKLSKNISETEELPFIFGKPDVRDFLKFKTFIDQSQIRYDQIKNLYFFPSKRWDIELKNNIILKLSKKNLRDSLNYSYKFLSENNFNNIKIIDARINNQIILNE